ncbi:MAG TPA: thioredoxin [Feifaniaceae bacterium]|nr:thioredoxin [Feifaniaceae bacterium]
MSGLVITQDNFKKEVLESETPVLVDFWASWCGPCRMLSPLVDQIAEEKEGALKVAKINVDDEPQLAAEFGVMSIPTLMLFRDGRPVSKSVGVRPKQAILGMLEERDGEAQEA